MRIVRRQARSDVVDHYQQAVGVRALCGVRRAPDLVEQRSGWAAAPGVVSVLNREIRAHDLLESGAARRLRAEALALLAQLFGDRPCDEVLLGFEVGVESAVGQPRVGHERGDPRAVNAVSLEPTACRLDDSLPRRLLMRFPVPSHARLHY